MLSNICTFIRFSDNCVVAVIFHSSVKYCAHAVTFGIVAYKDSAPC